jgi:hypothetical protein
MKKISFQNVCNKLLIGVVVTLSVATSANASNYCTYRVHPTAVYRSQPSFGFIYGNFSLISSQGTCPITQASVLQFSGVFDGPNSALVFRPAIDTCLDTASLLVVPSTGSFVIRLQDPYQVSTGSLIVNSQPGGLQDCQIKSN